MWHPIQSAAAAPWHADGDADAGGHQWPGYGRPRLLPIDNAALVVADEAVHGGASGDDASAGAAACRLQALGSFQGRATVPAAGIRRRTMSAWPHTAD